MAYLGIGTFSGTSIESEFSRAFASIGSTIPTISYSSGDSFTRSFGSIGSTIPTLSYSIDDEYSYPRDAVGINSRTILSFASTFFGYSAPFISNVGVTTNATFSGIASMTIIATEQIDITALRPMWKSYIFVGVSARPTLGQIYPR